MKTEVDFFTLLDKYTDSFIYEVIGKDFYEIMHKHKELFDLRDQPKDSKYFCNDNEKAPGKMKDEYAGIPIYEYIGLKPKINSLRNVYNHEKVYIKGIVLILNMINLKIHTLIKNLLDIIGEE